MKKSAILLISLTLLVTMIFLPACNQLSKTWWLELSYANEDQKAYYQMNLPITIEEDNTLSGMGILEARQLVEGDTTGFPECLAGETNGIRVQGEIIVIGTYRNEKILVESLEPTGGPGAFSLIYYCVKDEVERDVKIYKLDSGSTVGQVFANTVIDALYVFSEGMLKFPMDPVDQFSGHDEEGFTFLLHQGNLPESKKVPTPYMSNQ